MKSLQDSFLKNAHMLIIAVTLIVASVGWGGKLAQDDVNNTLTSYGYVPQYASDSGSYVVEAMAYGEVGSTMKQEDALGKVSKNNLFASDIEQRAQAFRDFAGAVL